MSWGTQRQRRRMRLVFASVLAAVAFPTGVVAAQDADQRAAAAEAYDRASGFYIQRNWTQAARWFETAHRLAPSAPALVQAARSHERAGNDLRAATLGLRLVALYAEDRAARQTANRLLEEAQPKYLRVDVECEGCQVELDGTLLEHPSFFVEPDRDYEVSAHFETGDRAETVNGPAGETRSLRFTAPPPPEPTPETETTSTTTTATAPPTDLPPSEGGGISPAYFLVAAGLTVAAGGVTLWSGLDTLSGVDAYEEAARDRDPDAPRMLEEGQDKELRTNLLIGATAGLGALTVVLALVTDWGSSDADGETEDAPTAGADVSLDLGLLDDGAHVRLGGRF